MLLLIPRMEINSLGGRTHQNAKCYRFKVKEWKCLSSKIEFERDWVYRPRYSNSFLLHNSKSTFELFNIRSEADYRLVYELRRIQDNLKVQDNAKELFVKIDDSYIRVYDSGKEKLRRPTEDFIKTPSVVFEYIKKCIVDRVNLF
jgi:hypothetical protein